MPLHKNQIPKPPSMLFHEKPHIFMKDPFVLIFLLVLGPLKQGANCLKSGFGAAKALFGLLILLG
ncbi:MAG: hypothetical protein EA353_02425, partial [Puniceicoccaceae bacterium]